MDESHITVGAWRRLLDCGLRDAAGALALRTALEAADQAIAKRALRSDRLDDVVQAALLLLLETQAVGCDDELRLAAWFARLLPRLDHRERRAAAAMRRPLTEREIATIEFRPRVRVGDDDSPAAPHPVEPFPALTDAEREAGAALRDAPSLAAAARALGISVGALRSRLAHARRRPRASPPRKRRTGLGRCAPPRSPRRRVSMPTPYC